MAIVTISRGSYSRGKAIAERVAERLGYECISRDVLLEASEHLNTPEIKLVRALHDAPSMLDRFTYGKERYLAYIQEAFLEHVQRDNVVYHGLAGHFFLKGIDHALKIRIIADLDDRIREEMEREGISEDEARRIIVKDDHERRKWSLSLYGIDTAKAWLYDLVVNIRNITIDEAVDLVCETAGLPQFQTTPESQKALDDLLMVARVKNTIFKKWPNVEISANSGEVVVHIEAPLIHEEELSKRIVPLVKGVPGVERAVVHLRPTTLLGTI